MGKNGWTKVAFGDVVRQVKDKVDPHESRLERYIAGEHMDTDDLKIRRWGLIGNDYLGPAFHMRFKPGHVLYGSRRTYLRKVALADFEGITANTTYVLESKDPGALLPELLPFIMQTEFFHEHSIKQSKGSVNPYINFSDIAWYEFELPPLHEQIRLVKTFQACSDLRESLIRADHAFSKMYQSAIDDWVESDAGSAPKISIERCPKVSLLEDVAKITDCKHRTPRLAEDGVPMVAPGDIAWGGLQLATCKRIAPTEYTSLMDHVDVEIGDLVLSRNQTYGIASYVMNEEPFVLGQDTVLVQPDVYTSPVIYILLRSTYMQRQIEKCAAGTTFGRINLGDIRASRCPFLTRKSPREGRPSGKRSKGASAR